MSDIKNVVSSCSSQFEPLAIKMRTEETGLVQELDLVKGSFIKMTTNGPESDNEVVCWMWSTHYPTKPNMNLPK